MINKLQGKIEITKLHNKFQKERKQEYLKRFVQKLPLNHIMSYELLTTVHSTFFHIALSAGYISLSIFFPSN
jgi:hypothetical protein